MLAVEERPGAQPPVVVLVAIAVVAIAIWFMALIPADRLRILGP